MSVQLECIGCRTQKIFPEYETYPVCPECKQWEDEKFRREHEETWLIVQREWGVKHNGYREDYVIPVSHALPVVKRPPIPDAFRWAIFERDNFTCQICGCRRYLTIDHIKPFSQGGELTFDNCQTLCRSCNSRKGAR